MLPQAACADIGAKPAQGAESPLGLRLRQHLRVPDLDGTRFLILGYVLKILRGVHQGGAYFGQAPE